MAYVFVWVALALVVGMAAGKRGRGSGTWFVLSVVASPLLGALFLFASKDLSQANHKSHRVCPKCAELVLREAVKCKHCASDLTPEPYQETAMDKLTKMR